MGVEIVEPNTCIRGCCRSDSIPLHLPPSSFSLLNPIARGAESVVYEAVLDGNKVAVKKPILSTSDHIDPQGIANAMQVRSSRNRHIGCNTCKASKLHVFLQRVPKFGRETTRGRVESNF
ncbi:hypothetical protein CsSME_00031452 [Camellia sinensis var. sinensis]